MSDPHPCVVVGFDGSPASHVALARGIERVGTTGKLYLVHAWEPPQRWHSPEPYQALTNRALTEAEALIDEVGTAHPGLEQVAWESELIGGPAARAIADVASVRHADEIILGTRGFGRVRALLGSVAHELIHLAACPVTVIPERMAPREGAQETAAAPAVCGESTR